MDDMRANDPPPGRAAGGEHVMPRWVKGFVVAALVVAMVLVVALVVGGEHGPGRHRLGSGWPASAAALA